MTMGAVMSLWTVYKHPKDFPRHFVARRFLIIRIGECPPTDDVVIGDTIDDVRAKLPPGLYRVDRQATDDPKIVEVWL